VTTKILNPRAVDTIMQNREIRYAVSPSLSLWPVTAASITGLFQSRFRELSSAPCPVCEMGRSEGGLVDQSEKQFRTIADALPVMLWSAGPDRNCTFFNKRWLRFTGHTLEEELARGWIASLHPADVGRCTADYRTSFDRREDLHFECRLRRADGEYRWLLVSGAPQLLAGGSFGGYIGVCTDVSEIRLVRRQALIHKRLETIGYLAAGIAHDFNNLLASIIAEAEVVLANPPANGASVTVGRIRTVAIRTSEIVRELMVYAGQDEGEMTAVDLSSLVEEMADLLRVSITKQAKLTTDLASNPPPVRAEAAELRQVVMNLILNASEAVRVSGGEIHLATSPVVLAPPQAGSDLPAGTYMRIEVSDTGKGIPAEVQAHVFDPYFTTKRSGRGIGLSVVRRIVRRYGGAILCQSAAGKGTRFVVLLPCASSDIRSEAMPELQTSIPSVPPGATLLVIEDEEGLRIPVSTLLRQKGMRVIEAADGNTAMKALQEKANEIDAILLDLTIPGLSSLEIIAAAGRIRPDIKIILTSAYSRRDAGEALAATQVRGFLRKPYQFRELSRLLDETLAGSRSTKTLTVG
jgi:two-component system, cell cycle sensor histidine kinase and response regulator CckA